MIKNFQDNLILLIKFLPSINEIVVNYEKYSLQDSLDKLKLCYVTNETYSINSNVVYAILDSS